ncbi:MAG: LamG domain-containing protein, partial [Parcubacteria group bacterium]
MRTNIKTISKLAVLRSYKRGFLPGSFFVSKSKKIFQNKSTKLVAILTLISLTSALYFTDRAQGVDFTFTQTDWSGGESAITATHTDNQTGWNKFSSKDIDISAVNGGADLQLVDSLDGATNPNIDDATSPTGVVYYSSQYNSTTYAAKNVFNDSALGGTGWIISAAKAKTGWITYDFGSAINVNKYRMAFYCAGCASQYLINWEIRGSNNTTDGNDGDWVALHFVTDGTDPGGTDWQPYQTFSNGNVYRFYQIKINDSGGTWPGIQEVEFIQDTRVPSEIANIDFNVEEDYIQEDATEGTDFVDGEVNLYNQGTAPEAALILHADGEAIPDSTTFGDPQIMPGKFGNSLYFNGGDRIAIDTPVTLANDFTIDWWQKGNGTGIPIVIGKVNEIRFSYNTQSSIRLYPANNWSSPLKYINGSTMPNDGQFHHVAAVRKDGVVYGYIDGVSAGSFVYANTLDFSALTLGGSYEGSYVTTGTYIDEFKITQSALWASDFMLPSLAYSIAYPATPKYVTTSNTSHLDTSAYAHITGAAVTQTTPAGTDIKHLVSFDGRITWKYWNGSSWQASALDDISTDGMAKATLEGLSQSDWESTGGFMPGVTTELDFASNLSTTDATATPTMDNIQINYNTPISQTLISSPYDTEVSATSLSNLQWSETLQPNTDIRFQLRTSSDGTTWGPWCGPDAGVGCDSDAYFTDSGNEAIDDTQKDHLDDRYFQYKATLSSSDGLNTPTLSSVTVSYATINAPTVATQTISAINSVTATGNADLTDTGGENPTRYIQWGATSNTYTDQCSAATGSTGTYSCALTNLIPDTTYYYRAKAVNSAGEAVGAEQSFRTMPAEVTINNPTPTTVTELLTDNYIVLDSGALTATDQVTTHVDVKFATGSNQITLPDNTAITNTEGGSFDMSAFDISLRDVRSEIADSLAAVKVGVPGTNLTFTNNPVAIAIYLGSQHNGKTMQVQYQNENETLWHDQTTCVITDGLCNFTTTHATTYTV